MPNLLDYGTLLTASGIVGGALLMLLAMQVRHPYPGFLRLVLAMDILAAAFIVGGLKIPPAKRRDHCRQQHTGAGIDVRPLSSHRFDEPETMVA